MTKVDLKSMRERAGMSANKLAKTVGTTHTTVMSWEKAGRIAKTEFLEPMAEALGVTVDELLGRKPERKSSNPGGRLGDVFRRVAKLPRKQQSKVIEMAEGFIALQESAEQEPSKSAR